jgi:hypothetical protein
MSSTASYDPMALDDAETDLDFPGVRESLLLFWIHLEVWYPFLMCTAWFGVGVSIWWFPQAPSYDWKEIYAMVLAASMAIGCTIRVGVGCTRRVAPAAGRFAFNFSRALTHLAKHLLIPHQWAMRFHSNRRGAVCLSNCTTSPEPLCVRCREIVDTSSLLSGGLWPFASSTGSHSHLSWQALQVSAGSCRLCQHLLASVKQPPPPPPTFHDFDVESQAPSVGSRGYDWNAAAPTGGEILKIRLTKMKSRKRGVTLHLQLEGKAISNPEVLSVKQGRRLLFVHS